MLLINHSVVGTEYFRIIVTNIIDKFLEMEFLMIKWLILLSNHFQQFLVTYIHFAINLSIDLHQYYGQGP